MSTPLANIVAFSRRVAEGITQLVYPPICWACGVLMPVEQGPACPNCLPRLTHDPFPTCPRCSSTIGPHVARPEGCLSCAGTSFAFDGAFRMAPYDGLLREIILRMKAWSGEELTEAIAPLWAKQLAPRVAPLEANAIIPVPLHWMRRWRRGFNPSEILARALGHELRIPCWPRLLWRSRNTAPQTTQPSGAARHANVKGAFTVRLDADLRDKALLLVDDVLTTGATLSEAARALRTLKPKSIHVVVMAHGK